MILGIFLIILKLKILQIASEAERYLPSTKSFNSFLFLRTSPLSLVGPEVGAGAPAPAPAPARSSQGLEVEGPDGSGVVSVSTVKAKRALSSPLNRYLNRYIKTLT